MNKSSQRGLAKAGIWGGAIAATVLTGGAAAPIVMPAAAGLTSASDKLIGEDLAKQTKSLKVGPGDSEAGYRSEIMGKDYSFTDKVIDPRMGGFEQGVNFVGGLASAVAPAMSGGVGQAPITDVNTATNTFKNASLIDKTSATSSLYTPYQPKYGSLEDFYKSQFQGNKTSLLNTPIF